MTSSGKCTCLAAFLIFALFDRKADGFGFPSNYPGGQNNFQPFPSTNFQPLFPNNNFNNYGQFPPMFTNNQMPQILVPTPNFPPIQVPIGPGYNIVTDSVSVNGSHSAGSGASAGGSASGSGVHVGGVATSSGSSNGGGSTSNSNSVSWNNQKKKPAANFPVVPYNNNYQPSYQPNYQPYPYSNNLVAVDYNSQPQVPQYQYWNPVF